MLTFVVDEVDDVVVGSVSCVGPDGVVGVAVDVVVEVVVDVVKITLPPTFAKANM